MAKGTTASNYLQMLREYKELHNSGILQAFKTRLNTFKLVDRRELLGVGISNILTLKYYKEMKSIDEVLSTDFFNASAMDLIEDYSKKQIHSTCSSLAIGIKFNRDEIRHYFHVKLPSHVDLPVIATQTWRFRIWKVDPAALMKGISIESSTKTNLVKTYYYLQKRSDIDSFVALSRLNIDPELLDHVELYFTDSSYKYNLIFANAVPEVSRQILTDRENKIVDEILPEIGKPILYTGRTEKEATVYFSFTQ